MEVKDSLSSSCSLPIDSGLTDGNCVGSAVSTGGIKPGPAQVVFWLSARLPCARRVLVAALTPTDRHLLVLGED